MKWLITGGCGFIGTNLVQLLNSQPNTSVRIVDNLSIGKVLPLHGGDIIRADILNFEQALEATKGRDIVVHLAAQSGVGESLHDPFSTWQSNLTGTLNYLEASRIQGVKKFIFASSNAVLGKQEMPLHEEQIPNPQNPYGASKLAAENLCLSYAKDLGLPTVCLRFSNVYGPYSAHKTSVVAQFLRKAQSGSPLEVRGTGEQTRDFLFAPDVAQGIAAAALSSASGEIFQLGSGQEVSVLRLAEKVQALAESRMGHAPALRFLPAGRGEVARNFSRCKKAESHLGWCAEESLDSGLRTTWDFLAQNYFQPARKADALAEC